LTIVVDEDQAAAGWPNEVVAGVGLPFHQGATSIVRG
jgi:hypothetical protein